MRRTEVYRIRLTPGEKTTLTNLAGDRGLSIAALIRVTFGLTPNVPVELAVSPPEATEPINEAPAPVEEVEPSKAPSDPHLAEIAERLGL